MFTLAVAKLEDAVDSLGASPDLKNSLLHDPYIARLDQLLHNGHRAIEEEYWRRVNLATKGVRLPHGVSPDLLNVVAESVRGARQVYEQLTNLSVVALTILERTRRDFDQFLEGDIFQPAQPEPAPEPEPTPDPPAAEPEPDAPAETPLALQPRRRRDPSPA